MKKTAKLINDKPGNGVHHKHYEIDPPMNGYRHVLVTRVNRELVTRWERDERGQRRARRSITLKHTLIQGATSDGESTTKRLRKYEYGITAAEALNRNNYTITH